MNYLMKSIVSMTMAGLGLLPVKAQAQNPSQARYIDIDEKNGKISVDYDPQNTVEAEYKSLSDAQKAQIKSIGVYRSDNGATLLKVDIKKKSYTLEKYFYQSAELKNGKRNAFVAVHEMGKYMNGEHTQIGLENGSELDITPAKMQVQDGKSMRVFLPAGHNRSLAANLYDANPDQYNVEYMFKSQNGDITVLTAPTHDDDNYYHFKAYKIQGETLKPLGDVHNVERMRDGGTTIGNFEDNGQTVEFYSPTPFTRKPATLNGTVVETLHGAQQDFITRKFASQMNIPGEQAIIVPSP